MARSGRGTAFARGKTVLDWAKASLWRPVQSNQRGDLCIAQGLPAQAELTRLGNSYWAESLKTQPASSLFPQSTANGNYWLVNQEPAGGKCYILDSVSTRFEGNPGAVQALSVIGHLFGTNPFPISQFTARPGGDSTILSLSGNKPYKGRGFAHSSVGGDTLGGVPDEGFQHFMVGSAISGNTNSNTLSITKDVYGRYIIPPGGACGFSQCASFSTLGATSYIVIVWHEVQLPLGG